MTGTRLTMTAADQFACGDDYPNGRHEAEPIDYHVGYERVGAVRVPAIVINNPLIVDGQCKAKVTVLTRPDLQGLAKLGSVQAMMWLQELAPYDDIPLGNEQGALDAAPVPTA